MSEPLIKTPTVFGENGNFVLECELGAGGMGGVYMGRDKMLDRPVAVKVMLKELGDDPEFVGKFKKEAQSAARLIHPNIAQIYSYGICEGMPYIAMELASGGSLYSIMNANRGKTDIARVIKICQQVAQALQCASDQGFVHGDIKPENILLDANGNAKLVDFGLAGMQKQTDEIWGTPYYISPEKVKKEPVDFRSDIYSLGGTLYHALTGVAPFEGDDSIAVIKKRFEGAPRKPSEIRPDLSETIDSLVMTMLAFNQQDRYPSFEALLEAFRTVLTTGLTTGGKGPTATAPQTPGLTRKTVVIRGGRRMMKRPAVRRSTEEDADEQDTGVRPSRRPARQDDEEEEGGNLGAKVAGAIIGVILLVGLVIGGLVWFQVADKKSRAAAEQAQISGEIGKARAAISETLTASLKFADEFDVFAARAIVECQKPTDELMKILPEEQASRLKPGPTAELLAAIASTNQVVSTDAAATNASAAVVQAPARPVVIPSSVAALPKFRDPTDEEKDPASPEGEAYEKAKREFLAEQAKKPKEAAASTNAPAEKAKAPVGDNADGKSSQVAEVVEVMNELWERAYNCQACAIRIRQAVRKIQAKCDDADAIHDSTKESMDRLGEISRTVVELFEQVKCSKDVEFVKKGISFIKSKGEKTVNATLKEIRLKKLKEERDEAARKAKEEEERRKREQEEARKQKVAEETEAAKARFDAIVTQGCFKQLDWKSALRMLNQAKDGITTPEGEQAFNLEFRKVNDMKMVQDIFLKNLKGHVFRGKLKSCKVEEVDEKEIVLYKPGSQSKIKIPWIKFYRDYPGNLNEIMNVYIVNARLPGAKCKISSLLEWANAMTGAALTMQLVCGDVTGAKERAETLIKTVVSQFPDYEKTAKEIFPDMTFEAKEEE